ncbi:hypothetical protein RBB50_011139 [Rhinocladiella similis]
MEPHLAFFRRRFSFLNNAKLNWRTFPLYTRPSIRHLATSRPLAKIIPPSSRTDVTSPRIRSYASSMVQRFGWYTRQQNHRPYVTEVCSVVIIYCVGDLSAQVLGADGYDIRRTLRSITIGAVVAIPSYRWFLFLARNFNYSSKLASTSVKVVVNQLFYTSLFNVYFFAFHAILSGTGMSGAIERVEHTIPTSLPRSFLYWPFVTALNLTYVQPQYRSVVTAIFAVFWQSYLSWLNSQAEKHDKRLGSNFTLQK